MTDKELNIALREMARQQGLCDEWFSQWSDDSTIDECLERYIKGFDFAVDNDYPTLDFIRRNFKKEVLHRHNIYLDEAANVSCENGIYVFLGNCGGTVNVDGLKAVTILVRHFCAIDVNAYNGAKVFVRYYDKSYGECKADGWSKCKKQERNKKEG